MAIVKVNRSGKSYPIYKENNADEQIGTLYNNELFTWKSAWEGNNRRLFLSGNFFPCE